MSGLVANSSVEQERTNSRMSGIQRGDSTDTTMSTSQESCRAATPTGLRALAIAASMAETSNVPESANSRIKAKRKRASPAQVAILKWFYAKNAFPDTECRLYLADKLGMTPRSVQIWFQNQRQHDKAAMQAAKRQISS